MQLKPSQRKQVKLRLGLSGASGFKKTQSALLLAYGMTGDWSKITIIDYLSFQKCKCIEFY